MPLNHPQIEMLLDAGLVYNQQELVSLYEKGVIQKYENRAINPGSLDIHLGKTIQIERYNESGRPISYRKREKLPMTTVDISEKPYVLRPGEFILGHSVEVFDFPEDLGALFRIKSSQGRIGFEHLDAGWVDPDFAGSLTLEYKSMLQFNSIEIQYGDPIGQLLFFPMEEVPAHLSYKKVGRYGGSTGVEQIK
jgi:deoxycytidine triphosphate deaminase